MSEKIVRIVGGPAHGQEILWPEDMKDCEIIIPEKPALELLHDGQAIPNAATFKRHQYKIHSFFTDKREIWYAIQEEKTPDDIMQILWDKAKSVADPDYSSDCEPYLVRKNRELTKELEVQRAYIDALKKSKRTDQEISYIEKQLDAAKDAMVEIEEHYQTTVGSVNVKVLKEALSKISVVSLFSQIRDNERIEKKKNGN